MADQFLAEIRIVGFNFPPKGWAYCDGQLLSLSQNTALFSLLGTTYGGNGTSNFALPDLQGMAPMHAGSGQGAGLSLHDLGETGGSESVTLLETEIPSHSHGLNAVAAAGTTANPGPTLALAEPWKQAGPADKTVNLYGAATSLTALDAGAVAPTGGSGAHENRQPYLVLNFVIAMQGIYPSRS